MALQPGIDNNQETPFEQSFLWSPGKSLGPYTGIEYVSSEKNDRSFDKPHQYINTGVFPSSNHTMELCFVPTDDFLESYGVYVGCRNDDKDKWFTIRCGGTNNHLSVQFGTEGWTSKTQPKNLVKINPINGREQITVKLNKEGVWVNGSYEEGSSFSDTFEYGVPILLCGSWGPKNTYYQPAKIKVYYLRIWEGNKLVRDYIPALYHEKGRDVAGLLDQVDNKFYKSDGIYDFNYSGESQEVTNNA